MPVQLRERDFGLIGYDQELRVIRCPVGTKLADLERPEFWSAGIRTIKPWSRLHIRSEDGSFYIERIVVAVVEGLPILKRCEFVDEEAMAEPDVKDGVRVEFVNELEGWRVVRIADAFVIKEKIREKREAVRQRTLYLKPAARAA